MYKYLLDLLFGEVISRSLDLVIKKISDSKFFTNRLYRKWIKQINDRVEFELEADRIFNIFINIWNDFETLDLAIKENAVGKTPNLRNEKFSKYMYKSISESFDSLSDIGESFLENIWNYLRTSFYDLLPTSFAIKDLSSKVNSHDNEISELQSDLESLKKQVKITPQNKVDITDDTNKYLDFYNKKLFLETDCDIKLSDIYIKLKYKIITAEQSGDLFEIVKMFIHRTGDFFKVTTNSKVLFIFGKPGSGKSSFVSYIAKHKNELCNNLYIIRLREMTKRQILSNSHLLGIADYLNCSISNLKNAVLVLDGLDEISAIYDRNFVSYIKELIKDCNNKNIILIITTRDGYFDYYNELDEFTSRVDIALWDTEDLNNWKDNYLKFHPDYKEVIESNIKILSEKNSYANIFSIPILFYMANAKRVKIEKHHTINSLYDEIFSDVFDNRKHDPTLYYNLNDLITRNLARQIAKEIAFSMHITGQLIYSQGNDPYIIPERVTEALKIAFQICEKKDKNTYLTEADKKKISELYALSFYYQRSNSDYYAVEFAHKTIAEYFIADKIVEMLFEINSENYEKINSILFDCFCCKPVTPIIFEFIREKIILKKGSKEYEALKKNLSKYFLKNCINGNLFVANDCKYYKNTNVLNILTCIFKSTLKILFDLNYCESNMDLKDTDIQAFCIIVDNISKIEELSKDYKIHLPFYLSAFDLSNGFFLKVILKKVSLLKQY